VKFIIVHVNIYSSQIWKSITFWYSISLNLFDTLCLCCCLYSIEFW